MKIGHVLIMAATIGGGLYLYWYVETNKRNSSTKVANVNHAEKKNDDTNDEVILDVDETSEDKKRSNDSVDYSSYSQQNDEPSEDTNRVIDAIEQEKLRKVYAEERINSWERRDNVTELDNYIDYRLRAIDPNEDKVIYTLAEELFTEPWEVNTYQQKEEANIIDDIYAEREEFDLEDEDMSEPTIGELVMYFVEKASYDLDISQAGVMEEMFRNVGLLDTVGYDEDGEITIDTQGFLKCVADIGSADIYESDKSIFGDNVVEELWGKRSKRWTVEQLIEKRKLWNQYQLYLNFKYEL